MTLSKEVISKKNIYTLIIILISITIFTTLLLLRRQKIVEGFQYVQPDKVFYLPTDPQEMQYLRDKGDFGYRTFLRWYGPPESAKMPDEIWNAIQSSFQQFKKYDQMLKFPEQYIRLDWRTHIPYTSPNNVLGCTKEWTEAPNRAISQSGIKYFVPYSQEFLNNSRPKCNIQITSAYLSSLPAPIASAWVTYIFNEQDTMTKKKRNLIFAGGGNCATRRDRADEFFSEPMRKAHEGRIKKEKEGMKATTIQNLKTDANSTLNTISKESGTTVEKLLADKQQRDTVKKTLLDTTSRTKNIRTLASGSAYGLVSGVMKNLGFDLVQEAFGGFINLLSGNPFAGTECPSGFEEVNQINIDPTIQKMNEIFPNPFSDLVTIGATTAACVKYENGKAEMKQKICRTTYVDDPTPMTYTALTTFRTQNSSSQVCPMDKDITKKLQLVSDYFINLSIAKSPWAVKINQFITIANVNDYYMECILNVSDFSKDRNYSVRDGNLYSNNTYVTKLSLYFKKSGCNYSIFGYFNERFDFIDGSFQVDINDNINYFPTSNTMFLLWAYAMEKNINNPVDYATKNLTNQGVINQVNKDNAERQARIEAERKERADLLAFLNPTGNELIGTALSNVSSTELKERKSIFELYNLDKTNPLNYGSIDSLRQKAKDEAEKIKIVQDLNPTGDAQIQTFLSSLSLVDIRERNTNKATRDIYIQYLNPLNSKNILIELTKTNTFDLQPRYFAKKKEVEEKEKKDAILQYLNPTNNSVLKSALEQLSLSELQAKETEKRLRDPLIQYFNPTNNQNLNSSFLDKFTTTQLQERRDLIVQLSPKNSDEISTLNALDIETLKSKAEDLKNQRTEALNYFKAPFPVDQPTVNRILNPMSTADLLERKSSVEQLMKGPFSPQKYWSFYMDMSNLDLKKAVELSKVRWDYRNDCLKPKAERTVCPATYPY